ncbi:MAG: hypothetical protein LC791_04175 [Acidobacteria bacterium]|nr:hypothetical protein [Acidobacteriota bacterium]
MDLWTGVALAVVLCIALWVPYFILNTRQGKARGHTWFTRKKPRGHSDIGPDVGVPQTKPGADEARGARY